MLSDWALAASGVRARYYRALFLGASVWNALSAGAVLFFLTNAKSRQEMGFPGAPDAISLQLLACCLFLFGLGYYWVSQDISRNRDLVKLGAIGKPLVFLVFFGHAFAGDISWLLTAPSLVDLLFGALFLEFLVRSNSKAQ